jgi:hypothetical protein
VDNISVHAATLIGWRTSSGSCHNYTVCQWKGVRTMSLLVFFIEVNVYRGGWKIAVLQLFHGATLQSAVEGTVDLHCKTVCFNQLFGEYI